MPGGIPIGIHVGITEKMSGGILKRILKINTKGIPEAIFQKFLEGIPDEFLEESRKKTLNYPGGITAAIW